MYSSTYNKAARDRTCCSDYGDPFVCAIAYLCNQVPIADDTSSRVRRDTPAANYTVPPFPSLFWPPQAATVILYELDEMWKFTLFWTIILYGLFHLGAVGVAVLMQGGKRMSSWKYLWLVPLIYAFIAGAEALIAGTLVGLMFVSFLSFVSTNPLRARLC